MSTSDPQPRRILIAGANGSWGLDTTGPLLISPLYKLFEWVPATRESAHRLGLLGINTMLNSLIQAIENPPSATRIWDVPTLRQLGAVIH
jgi:hypothetical protein